MNIISYIKKIFGDSGTSPKGLAGYIGNTPENIVKPSPPIKPTAPKNIILADYDIMVVKKRQE
jgi:hypothetical protein